MRKVIWLGFLLLVMVVPVQAQDADYRLREPDVVAYLEAVPNVLEAFDASSDDFITEQYPLRLILFS